MQLARVWMFVIASGLGLGLLSCADKTLIQDTKDYQYEPRGSAPVRLLQKSIPTVRLLVKSDTLKDARLSPIAEELRVQLLQGLSLAKNQTDSPILLFSGDVARVKDASIDASQSNRLFFNPALANARLDIQVMSLDKVPLAETQSAVSARNQALQANNSILQRYFTTVKAFFFTERPFNPRSNLSTASAITTEPTADTTLAKSNTTGQDANLPTTQGFSAWAGQLFAPQTKNSLALSCSYGLRILGAVSFSQSTAMENPTEPATTFPFTFYSLLPTAQDVSQVNSLLPTQKEWTKFSCLAGQAIDKNWQALLIRQLVSYLGPSMQEYLRLHGMAVNFMGNKARTLVKVNLGLNWSIQRGEKLTFYRLRFNPTTLQLEYTELTQGIVTVLLNNSFAWVSVPKPAANKILWGDLSLKQTGSLTHFLNF